MILVKMLDLLWIWVRAMESKFAKYHPLVNFIYFFFVIGFTMFLMHPIFLGISLISAIAYSIQLNGKKAIRFNMMYMLPLLLVTAVFNPLFNHKGATILAYLPSGNPVTMESIYYGMASATMFITVIIWFSCYNKIMTSDKFIYLFGKILPSISLIITMVLRFVPNYKRHANKIAIAQDNINNSPKGDGLIDRLKQGISVLSVMTTWALENSLTTADSMKARGYGLEGRSTFTLFIMTARDKILFLLLLLFSIITLWGSIKGYSYVRYFPTIAYNEIKVQSILIYVSYFILCNIPTALNIMEDIKWKYLKSRI